VLTGMAFRVSRKLNVVLLAQSIRLGCGAFDSNPGGGRGLIALCIVVMPRHESGGVE
jgi:hypothetical protein